MDIDELPENSGGVVATTELSGPSSLPQPSTLAFATQVDQYRSPSPVQPTLSTARSLEQNVTSLGNTALAPGHDAGASRPSIRSPSRHHPADGTAATPHASFVIVPPAPRHKYLPYSTSRSGIVYDTRMRFHVDPSPEAADDAHPEQPRRIYEIYEELREAGLVGEYSRPEDDSDDHLLRIPIEQATPPQIALIHSEQHVAFVQSLAGLDQDELRRLTREGESIYYHNLSWLCASLSAGGAIAATRAVLCGSVKNAVAVIRPPGHHAEHGEAQGFCFFNNVCIAARVCQQQFPETCRKVLILDWDVHHGNGIQRAFYDDPNVLYISLHVYKNAGFYPFNVFADHTHCGDGAGTGRNVNIPWAATGMTDADYIMAFQQVVMPIAIEFDPDLVMISAGFDAAVGDPLGDCLVTPAGYAHMTHMLMQLAGGNVVACLEGGYNLRSIAVSALAMTRTLMGEPPDRVKDFDPTPSAINTVLKVIRTQSKFWKSLYPKDLMLTRKKELGSERLHDIVREWQSNVLWEQYGMTSLFIMRQRLSRSFKDQVIATSNYHERRPLLVIFHDPPDAEGYPDPRTNKLELHNTFLTDVSKTYVDWAVKNDFAVIDVNVPKHITEEDDDKGYVEADEEKRRSEAAYEVALYLWDNYIDVSDCSHVFLMGVGDAYSGIIDLLSKHEQAVYSVDLMISFVASHTLRCIQKANDDSVSQRYYNNSMVFVANDHGAFEPERAKKLKRRYGNITKSPHTDLPEMLAEHKDQVTSRLLEESEEWRAEVNRDGLAAEVPRGPRIEISDEDDKMEVDPVRKNTPPKAIFTASSATARGGRSSSGR